MGELLQTIDASTFYFVNHTLQNFLFDAVMPYITDLNKKPPALVLVGGLWLLLLVKGGRMGRTAALLLIPTIAFSDQLNSSLLKSLFGRVRPCHELPDVHLLVDCGGGLSFPSSHAVNNFAGAAVLSYYYPKWLWAFGTFAGVVAFSRVYVGVHYPGDVVAGAVVGVGCGALVVVTYLRLERWWEQRGPNEQREGQ